MQSSDGAPALEPLPESQKPFLKEIAVKRCYLHRLRRVGTNVLGVNPRVCEQRHRSLI